MAVDDYGQCLDCGRVYSNPYQGDRATPKEQLTFLPDERQPPTEKRRPFERNYPEHERSYRTSRTHHQQVGVWEGHNISHGYCAECDNRDSAALQWHGPVKGAKSIGKTPEEAFVHWWWRRPQFPKRHERKEGL